MTRRRGRSLVAGAILAALLSSISVTLVTRLWTLPLHVPFQYAHAQSDDEQDATLDMMLIKNISETGWFDTNPKLNAPFAQHWAEWPMGGDLLAYTVKKALVDTTGDVPLTFNLFWLMTFPLAACAAFPALRTLRCSWSAALDWRCPLFGGAVSLPQRRGAREPRVLHRRTRDRAVVCEDSRTRFSAAIGERPPTSSLMVAYSVVAARRGARRCDRHLLPRVSVVATCRLLGGERAGATPAGTTFGRRAFRCGRSRHVGCRELADARLPMATPQPTSSLFLPASKATRSTTRCGSSSC